MPFSNAFIGNYLRLELLSREGRSAQILDESIAEYLKMADQTGTLWEHLSPTASCCHGFASHVIRVLNRDVLGVRKIDPIGKVVTLQFADCGLRKCQGSIPVGDSSIDICWTITNNAIDVRLSLPEGYTYELTQSENSLNNVRITLK